MKKNRRKENEFSSSRSHTVNEWMNEQTSAKERNQRWVGNFADNSGWLEKGLLGCLPYYARGQIEKGPNFQARWIQDKYLKVPAMLSFLSLKWKS